MDSSLQALQGSINKFQKTETFSGAKSVIARLQAVTRGRLGFCSAVSVFCPFRGANELGIGQILYARTRLSKLHKNMKKDFRKEKVLLGGN